MSCRSCGNILKGDMSIVGPRPALPREVEQYGDYEKQRLYVTPGLSCYWQIAPHRNELSFEEWMDLDIKYVQERSFWVDWKIIFKTFKVCLLGPWRIKRQACVWIAAAICIQACCRTAHYEIYIHC